MKTRRFRFRSMSSAIISVICTKMKSDHDVTVEIARQGGSLDGTISLTGKEGSLEKAVAFLNRHWRFEPIV